MKMEECALCGKRARMHCDSDQASLCWDCDEEVHAANFLVAKHSRILLCCLCQSPTPWKASGTKLPPTDSLCHHCVANRPAKFHQLLDDHHRDYEDDDGEYSSDADFDNGYDEDDIDDEDVDGEEEEGENQVVPWSSVSASPPPPPRSATSDADGDISTASGVAGLALKRFRNNSFSGNSDNEMGCSSSPGEALTNDESTSSMSVFRPLKQHIIDQRNHSLI